MEKGRIGLTKFYITPIINMNMKKNITVLSLDTSSTVSGWALFINGRYKKSGILDFKKIRNVEDRTKNMCLSISKLIQLHSPTHIVIEELSSTRNAQTTRLLSKIIGTVYFQAIKKNIQYCEISCSKWRHILGITSKYRKTLKKESIERVLEKYNIKADDNEADAINIGEAYCIIKNKMERKRKQ